jgi:hypothetical protein
MIMMLGLPDGVAGTVFLGGAAGAAFFAGCADPARDRTMALKKVVSSLMIIIFVNKIWEFLISLLSVQLFQIINVGFFCGI